MKSYNHAMARILFQVDQKIREAEALTVAPCDPEMLRRASKVLAGLKNHRRFIESRIRQR
jgi:hypothetical protein